MINQIVKQLEFMQTLPEDYKKYERYCKKCNSLILTPFIARTKLLVRSGYIVLPDGRKTASDLCKGCEK